MKNDNLKRLSKGRTGELLLTVVEEMKAKVADIRTPLKLRPEIANEVRLGIIEALDLFLVEPLKMFNNNLDMPDEDENV